MYEKLLSIQNHLFEFSKRSSPNFRDKGSPAIVVSVSFADHITSEIKQLVSSSSAHLSRESFPRIN